MIAGRSSTSPMRGGAEFLQLSDLSGGCDSTDYRGTDNAHGGASKMTRARARLRLAALVWPFVAVVLVQAVIASLSLYTLSAVRAYVGGESLWSKGQKAAIY